MNSTIIYHPAIKSANVAGFSGDVQVVEGDLRDRPTVERVFANGKFDTVIHLAARAGVRASIEKSCKLPGKLLWQIALLSLESIFRNHFPPLQVMHLQGFLVSGHGEAHHTLPAGQGML